MEYISTSDAPEAIGPYSQAISVGNLMFVSGQLPLDKDTMEFHGDNIVDQTEQVMTNIDNIVKSQGLSLANIVKTTVFLSDMNNFAQMNETYAKRLDGHKPARATIEVARLPKDALVEIEAIVSIP